MQFSGDVICDLCKFRRAYKLLLIRTINIFHYYKIIIPFVFHL